MSDNENSAACRGCGVLSDQDVRWYERQASIGPKGPVPPGRYRRSTCEDCQSLDFDTPGAAVRACLRLIGRPEGDWPIAAEVFATEGLDATEALFPGGEASRSPWRHVEGSFRRNLKRAYVKVLVKRVERDAPPVPVPPPMRRGDELLACMVCGRAEDVGWHGFVSLPTRGNGVARGSLCASTCAPVFAHIGAFGTQFLANAYYAAQGKPVDLSIDSLPGLRAFYTLTPEQQQAVTGPWSWYSPPEPIAPIERAPDMSALLEAQIAALRQEVAALKGGSA
jgi:hypothetical protein